MKRKEMMYMLVAVAIFLTAGYLAFTQLAPKRSTSTTVEVEKIGIIPRKLDDTGLSALNDPSKVVNYNSPVDLTGLGNGAVFGP